jgi:hypothetical protein
VLVGTIDHGLTFAVRERERGRVSLIWIDEANVAYAATGADAYGRG